MSNTLPAPLTSFVGREIELAQAAALLAEARLLTLTGPGGAGKTRLALRLASVVAEQFPDGVWFVDLSPLSGGEFVWDRVAITLGIREPGQGRTWAESVREHLGSRHTVVVLDNCEHVVKVAAEVAASLLDSAPDVKVLATSREPLGVGGEVTWAVPPLIEADAVELFVDRARQALPQFKLRDGEREAVLDICRRLDGIPLAIELAAARTRALDPARIAAGLKDRLAVLPSGPRTAPRRQASLQASFDWSYELLSDPERALLRQLSVFAGGFDVDAALAVCPTASLDLLAELADRSLIIVERRSGEAEARYRMLETVRRFAAEHLDEAEEVQLMRTGHRDHYLELAEKAAPQLFGPEQARMYARLRTEQDNLRAALAWSRDQGEAEALARMVVALAQFWAGRGRFLETKMWMEAAADRADHVSPRMRAWIRLIQSFVPIFVGGGSFGDVPVLANEARDLARAAGDKGAEGFALLILGMIAGLIGGAEAMRPYMEEALPLVRSADFGGGFAHAFVLGAFVILRWFQSDPEEPRRLSEEAIAVAKAAGDRHACLWAMWIGGVTALIHGRLAAAAHLFEIAVADGREAGDTVVGDALLGLAWVAMYRGDFAAARAGVAEGSAAVQESEPAEGGMERLVDPLARWILGWVELAGGGAAQARDKLLGVVEVFGSSPVPRLAAVPLVVLAEAQLALGTLGEAEASLDEVGSLAGTGKLTWVLGRAALVRAKLRARQGEPQEAEPLVHEALRLGREAGDEMGLVDALEALGRLAAEQDSLKEAVRLWAAAESMRLQLGYRFTVDRSKQYSAVAQANESLGPDDFAAAWAEGAKLSVDEALAYAARGRGERKRPATGWASLTPSEVEVVRLVGEHLSNPEIASRLFVSRATVKSHLLHVFAKLGVASRSELVAEALRRRIQPVSRGHRPAGRPADRMR